MKRLSLVLALALCVSLLTGCAGTPVVYQTNCTCPVEAHTPAETAAPAMEETVAAEAPAVEGALKTGLYISTGIGDTKIDSLEVKDAKISAGIGKTTVGLKSKAEDYSIEVSKGIGSITLNGSSVSDDDTIGSGARKLDISGGIGSIEITTAE